MKKRIFALTLIVLLIGGTAFAEDGDLIVNGKIGIGTTTPGEKLEVNGNVKATAFYYSSDERLKTNIAELDNSLEKLTKLTSVSFMWKADGKKDIGLLAQDVEQVYPELVRTDHSTGLKSVEYGHLIAPLVESIKTLKEQNETQEAQILELLAAVEGLKRNR